MDALRSANAHVATATHPYGNARWRLQRFNPINRLQWQKNRVTHPVAHQRAHTRARMNLLNLLYYMRASRTTSAAWVGADTPHTSSKCNVTCLCGNGDGPDDGCIRRAYFCTVYCFSEHYSFIAMLESFTFLPVSGLIFVYQT